MCRWWKVPLGLSSSLKVPGVVFCLFWKGLLSGSCQGMCPKIEENHPVHGPRSVDRCCQVTVVPNVWERGYRETIE